MIDIIVTIYFNRIELYPIIMETLDSYKKFSHPNMRLVLCDDHSPLDIVDFLQHADEVFIQDSNKGYVANVNQGLKESKADIIVAVDDDIIFNADIMDKIQTIKNGIYYPTWEGETKSDDDKFGFFWGLDRKTLDKLGYLDERFKHYFADTDLWKRAKIEGVELFKWWDCPVVHHGASTIHNENYKKDMETYKEKWGQID